MTDVLTERTRVIPVPTVIFTIDNGKNPASITLINALNKLIVDRRAFAEKAAQRESEESGSHVEPEYPVKYHEHLIFADTEEAREFFDRNRNSSKAAVVLFDDKGKGFMTMTTSGNGRISMPGWITGVRWGVAVHDCILEKDQRPSTCAAQLYSIFGRDFRTNLDGGNASKEDPVRARRGADRFCYPWGRARNSEVSLVNVILPREIHDITTLDGVEGDLVHARISGGGRDLTNYVSRTVYRVSRSVTEQCLRAVREMARHHTREATLAWDEYDVPSLLVRIDGVVSEVGGLEIFEVEARPGGAGMCMHINAQFRAILEGLLKKWPPVFCVAAPDMALDDHLWVRETFSPQDANKADGLVLVRSWPADIERLGLNGVADRSMSTLEMDGCKAYGGPMGLWREVNSAGLDDLPWSEGFCLKPRQGTRCSGIEVFSPNGKGSTRAQVGRTLGKHGTMFIQRLIHPMTFDVRGVPYDSILRLFFGFDTDSGEWIPMGGLWNGRKAPCLRLHGASDAVFGAAVIDE